MSPPPPLLRKEAAPDWAALPPELLALVAERLRHSVDYVRFRSVCSRWRAAARRIPFPPLLALPFDPDAAALPFFDPSEIASSAAVHSLPLPEARHQALLGSSRGWLFLIDEAGSVSLLNPFTRARFCLPPVTESLARASSLSVSKVRDRWVLDHRNGKHPVTLYHMRSTFISEATLSSSPSEGDECAVIIVAVLASSTKLAFCRIGDREWTLFNTALHNFVSSVAYCDGRFYAVDAFGEVCVCDVGISTRATYISSLMVPPERDSFRIMGLKKELLLVAHYMDGDFPHFKHHYEIYRTDIKRRMKWYHVDTIGGRTVFLSVHFNSNAIGGAFYGCKSNAMYFSEPIRGGREPSRSQIHKMAVMDVTNGCLESHNEPDTNRWANIEHCHPHEISQVELFAAIHDNLDDNAQVSFHDGPILLSDITKTRIEAYLCFIGANRGLGWNNSYNLCQSDFLPSPGRQARDGVMEGDASKTITAREEQVSESRGE
ncbi:unnamed protein product [Musa banksii]